MSFDGMVIRLVLSGWLSDLSLSLTTLVHGLGERLDWSAEVPRDACAEKR